VRTSGGHHRGAPVLPDDRVPEPARTARPLPRAISLTPRRRAMLDVRSALRRAAGFHRDSVAIISGEQQLTFGQAWERGLRLATGLAASGLRPGDRVAVLEDN